LGIPDAVQYDLATGQKTCRDARLFRGRRDISDRGAVVVGGLSALGAALYSIGIPKDSAIAYESAVKADGFLVMAHGSADEVERARKVLEPFNPSRIDVHEGPATVRPAEHVA